MDPLVVLGTIALVATVAMVVAFVGLGKLVFRFWDWIDNELQRRQH